MHASGPLSLALTPTARLTDGVVDPQEETKARWMGGAAPAATNLAVADAEHSGDELRRFWTSRDAAAGEYGESEAAELPVLVDLTGEERSGGGGDLGVAEEKEGAILRGSFCRKACEVERICV